MSDKELEEKVIEEIEEEKRIIGDDSIKESSYQPTEDTLDQDNPPGGDSGVPEKNDD